MNKHTILITAGPTRENIDPVRFISNRSSGKMGYALAEVAVDTGNDVTLISGPVNIPAPIGVELVNIESAEELACEVRKSAKSAEIIFMVAAVADYRPKTIAENKIKKTDGDMVLEFERTTDILAELGERSYHSAIVVGFAAETENVIKNSKAKLEKKNVDWIIANDVSRTDAGLGSDNNTVTMISKKGEVIELPLQSKKELAAKILEIILKRGI